MKRAIIVHGWASNPNDCWFPWLKKELESREFAVSIPAMPDPEIPKIGPWVSALAKTVGQSDEDTYLVGHSIGCQTILRYVESLPENQRVGSIVCVAGWTTLMGLEPDELEIAKPWLETPINFEKVKRHAAKIIAFFSDDDSVVPLENAKTFEHKLGATVMIEQGKGHYDRGNKITKIPSLLEFF